MVHYSPECLTSFFNTTHTTPFPFEIFLPQADFVISTTDRQHISTLAPADPPQHRIEIKHCRLPLVGSRRIGRPYSHRLVLTAGGDVGFLHYCRCPCNVTHPVRVARECERVSVGLFRRAEKSR